MRRQPIAAAPRYSRFTQKGMFSIMAKQTMEAIRQAELAAEQSIRDAQSKANADIAKANTQAEEMIAAAKERAGKKLADTRTAALHEAEQISLASAESVTREIEALERQGQKNRAKAISAVIAEMN